MNFLITAGPTRERIDPVRYLSNFSSGKMGYAIAEAAKKMGNNVVLITGPVTIEKPKDITVISVESANEMYLETVKFYSNADIIIMTAAVADYTPVNVSNSKVKKQDDNLNLELKRTKDILFEIGKIKSKNQILVGFAAETNNVSEYAKSKLINKNCDWVVANQVGLEGTGFGAEDNKVTLFAKNGEKFDLPVKNKKELAFDILNLILHL